MKRTGKEFRENSAKTIRRSLNKTTLIFIILFLLGLIGIGLVILFVNKATGLDIDEPTYQYFAGSRYDHYEAISLNNSEISTILTEDNEEKALDYTPIYTSDDDVIYLPISYSYADTNNESYWRVPEFMKLTKDEATNIVTCTYNENEYDINCGFLFDGGTQYIFLDAGTITIDDKEYDVTPFSFYSGDYYYGIYRIYNLKTKEFTVIDNSISSAIYKSNSGYSVNLIRGIYTHRDGFTELLIASPSLLEDIGNR